MNKQQIPAWRPNGPDSRLDRSGNERHRHEAHSGLIKLIKLCGLPGGDKGFPSRRISDVIPGIDVWTFVSALEALASVAALYG